ncbi:precorrin-2 C(20)-methyltransferase [Bengtsoniella intestinalis]|uniref:precorrin-2 C(20)-methyltransferase n=1 Tax=Bengtsoniella intestinalis TaxID=3073143 RepID=UPI00391F131B
MSKGILYGLGVGPGDPELLTLKGARLLREADVVAVPDKGSGEKTALNIVKDHVDESKVIYCPTPMVRDMAVLDGAYDQIADTVCALLDEGKTVVFITLGDPAIYSTYVYVHQRVVARGYEAELVPGVPSFCAVAARLGMPLCERSERLMIVPASHKDVDDCLAVDANYVFMKAGKDITALQETLANRNLLSGASMVENCGMDGERVYHKFGELDAVSGYFSVVVVKHPQ